MNELKKNQIYTVTIEAYSSEAWGLSHIEGCVVFVPRAIPGEVWEIKLLKVTASSAYAKGLRLLEASPNREEPTCPYFGSCGGCDAWHMSYAEELRFKLGKVNGALKHIGRQDIQAEEIISSDCVNRYRNKGIFAVAQTEQGAASGFYRQRSHQLIPVKSCLIQNELSERAAGAVTEFLNRNNISPYNEETGKGGVRHVFCRRAVNSNDAVVCIVSARGFGYATQALVEALRAACPELTGIVLNINKQKGNTILGGDFHTLWGKADIRDSLCGLSFNIAPQAFFQINPRQAERLYQRALEYAEPTAEDVVLDLYCGAGTISLCLAKKAGRVIGAEIVPEAIENAKRNAEKNGIDNTEFICADAGQAALLLSQRRLDPQVVVVDPPRKGMEQSAIGSVAAMRAERIVYVSCNPATLARDILRFQELDYTLKAVTAVDMFPRTCHVETVVLMSKKDS